MKAIDHPQGWQEAKYLEKKSMNINEMWILMDYQEIYIYILLQLLFQ